MSPHPRSVVLPALIGEHREDIGGIAAYVIALEKRLRRRGVQVKILGYGEQTGSDDFQSVITRAHPRGRDLTWELWKRRKSWNFSPDTVIHLQRPDQAFGFSRGEWPLVISIHGVHRQAIRAKFGPLAEFAYHHFQASVAKRANAFIFETRRDMAQYLSQVPVAREKSHFVPIGIDRDTFCLGDQNAARRTLGLPQDVPAIVYLGRLETEKKVINLVRALKHLPGTELWIAGRGKQEAELRREAGPQVRFLGFLPSDQIPVFLRASDVLALASEYEGLAPVVLQAWASGRPVVVPPVGDFPALLSNGGGVLAKDNRPESLIHALNQVFAVLGEPGRRQELEKEFREKSKPYDWENITNQICEVYCKAGARKATLHS